MEEEDHEINLQERLTAAIRGGGTDSVQQLIPEMHAAELAAVYESMPEDERAALRAAGYDC